MSDFTVRYCPDVDPQVVIDKIVFNPNYGCRTCRVPNTCIIPVIERKMKPMFFDALRESVAKDGFRNPIILYDTYEGLLLAFGGSRLRVAKELDVPIPAIVVDYTGKRSDAEEVTLDNFEEFFTDVPEYFEFTNVGVDTHYSLERNRRHTYDPAGFAWTDGKSDEFLKAEFPWLDNE